LKNKVEHGSLRWLNDEIENLEKTSVVTTKRFCVKCKTVKMISVIFGESSILIDWCPKCHGMWLDRGEFESISAYLANERAHMHPKEIEEQAAKDIKRVISGGPENRFDELRDAEAAISAMINATIFEHPKLFNFCMDLAHF